MQYRMIAIDMDGSLLDSNRKISDNTISAIKKARKAGVIVTVATGRSIRGVEIYRKILPIKAPLITYNGAVIIDLPDREILYDVTLEEKVASDIIDFGKKFSTTMCIWFQNQLYVYEINERVAQYTEVYGIHPIIIDNEAMLIQQGITKILWFDEINNIKKYQQELEISLKGNVNFCTSSPYFLEFFDGDASKGNALKFLGEYYNIDASEMIAIGDGMNDVPMIEYAGLGVAMGNAPEELKELSDFITLTNDEDGVAHVIEQFVLNI